MGVLSHRPKFKSSLPAQQVECWFRQAALAHCCNSIPLGCSRDGEREMPWPLARPRRMASAAVAKRGCAALGLTVLSWPQGHGAPQCGHAQTGAKAWLSCGLVCLPLWSLPPSGLPSRESAWTRSHRHVSCLGFLSFCFDIGPPACL